MKLRWPLPSLVAFTLAALAPTYLIRFRIGPIPTTVLEVVLLVAIGLLLLEHAGGAKRGTPNGADPAPTLGGAPMGVRRDRTRVLLTLGSLLILVSTVISITVAPDHLSALGIAKAYFWEPMLLAWLLMRTNQNITKPLIAGFAVSASVVIGWGFIQYAFPHLIPAPWNVERRATSVFPYPNASALFLAPLLPLFLLHARTRVLAPLGILIIFLVRSTGGLIAGLGALVVVGLTKKQMRLPLIGAGVLLLLVVAFAPPAGGIRDQLLMRDWSGRVHMIGWKESFAFLRDHPLTGAGLSGFPTAVIPYHTAQGVEIFQYPHNLFLAIWSELGALGVIGFIILFVWCIKKTNPFNPRGPIPFGEHRAGGALATTSVARPDSNGGTTRVLQAERVAGFATMLAILIHGLVDVPYFKNDLALMFWLFIAAVAIIDKERYARA